MARTTEELVRGVVEVDDAYDLIPHIDNANYLVTAVCLPAGLSEAGMTRVETMLAAHFYCLMDPRINQEGADTAKAVYEGATSTSGGTGLSFTRYGQQALRFDTTGALAAFEQRCKTGKFGADTQILGPPRLCSERRILT